MIGDLIPRPRLVRIDDAGANLPVSFPADGIIEGGGPETEAWQLLADEHPESLPPDGYLLRIERHDGAVRAVLVGDDAGRGNGRARLAQLAELGTPAPAVTIRDWPELAVRGTVEGFYGPPWSAGDRSRFLRFSANVGLNCFLYAPKDDPYARDRWREPYPEPLLAELMEFAAEAHRGGVRFIYGISPGLTMRYSAADEHRALADKAAQLWDAGIRAFALLFDDVPMSLHHDEDQRCFGSDPRSSGRAQGEACRRFVDDFLAPRGVAEPLMMCPTEYAGVEPTPYRDGLAETLPADALVMWTGADVIVGEITRADIDAAAASYRRRLVLWDNFPVNDFDRSRLFLGPLTGRATDLERAPLAGVLANPMIEAAASHLPLATVADWAWHPAGYSPADAARRARSLVAGEAPGVATLARVSGSWPPSAPQSEEVLFLTRRVTDGDWTALLPLERLLRDLAGATGEGAERSLAETVAPWLAAARDAGTAGLLAVDLLRRLGAPSEAEGATQPRGADVALHAAAVREAQETAERHYPNVLRGILPGFVQEVLSRAGVGAPPAAATRRAVFLAGSEFSPGDRDLIERLTARGIAVEVERSWPSDLTVEGADLAVLANRAPVEWGVALAGGSVPVLAWGRFQELGIAHASGVLFAQEELEIAEPGDPLAAGFAGRVRVHRGPGKVTWSEPVDGAAVIARATENGAAAIAHVPAGTRRTTGEPLAADRLGFFLAGDGLAPWLLTDDGRALFTAAVDRLIGA